MFQLIRLLTLIARKLPKIVGNLLDHSVMAKATKCVRMFNMMIHNNALEHHRLYSGGNHLTTPILFSFTLSRRRFIPNIIVHPLIPVDQWSNEYKYTSA